VAKILGAWEPAVLNALLLAVPDRFQSHLHQDGQGTGHLTYATEITGMCGRLRCCLIYEYEQYVEARKLLPKRNKRVVTRAAKARWLMSYRCLALMV